MFVEKNHYVQYKHLEPMVDSFVLDPIAHTFDKIFEVGTDF